jgi:uncharacterized protein (DUF433 family)
MLTAAGFMQPVAHQPTGRVVKEPGHAGGEARIRGTRIPVWALLNLQRLGESDAGILDAYPKLSADDLAAAWEYAGAHAEELDGAIRENEEGEEGLVE